MLLCSRGVQAAPRGKRLLAAKLTAHTANISTVGRTPSGALVDLASLTQAGAWLNDEHLHAFIRSCSVLAEAQCF